jgi:hypothetical protein
MQLRPGLRERDRITDLAGLLDQLDAVSEGKDEISVEAVLKTVGQRSFGSLLLLPGLMALSPLSGIPGMPTLFGVMVLLITSQLLMGRTEFWLPQFILRRAVSRSKLDKAVKTLRPVARFMDRLSKPRLRFLAEEPAVYVIAAFCLLVSLITPLLELLPFAISIVGGAVSAFGLALISHDGVLAMLAFAFCIAAVVIIVMSLL